MNAVKVTVVLLVLFLAGSVGVNVYLLWQKSLSSTVVRVIDGDSFETQDSRRIRLLSIDAPERDRCLYTEAKEKLISLVLYKKVRFEDVVKDDYGRLLANVFVRDTFVNKEMLIDGLARFTYATSPQYNELKLINQKASNLKIGVYSPLCRTTSMDASCKIKANNNHGKKFFFTPTCRNYEQVIVDESYGDKWFCSESEAVEEGFTKATNCR